MSSRTCSIKYFGIPNPGIPSNNQGNGVSLNLNVVNADPGSITATGLPAGLSINSTTGVISGTVFAPAGTYTVTVSASDHGVVSHLTFPWVVNQMPAVVAFASIQNTYVGLTQVETITALVTNAAGIPVNDGIVTFQVNGETVTAAVSHGLAIATIETPLFSFDWTILMSDFYQHTLSVSYGDPAGIFGSISASSTEQAMLLDFFLFLYGELSHGAL